MIDQVSRWLKQIVIHDNCSRYAIEFLQFLIEHFPTVDTEATPENINKEQKCNTLAGMIQLSVTVAFKMKDILSEGLKSEPTRLMNDLLRLLIDNVPYLEDCAEGDLLLRNLFYSLISSIKANHQSAAVFESENKIAAIFENVKDNICKEFMLLVCVGIENYNATPHLLRIMPDNIISERITKLYEQPSQTARYGRSPIYPVSFTLMNMCSTKTKKEITEETVDALLQLTREPEKTLSLLLFTTTENHMLFNLAELIAPRPALVRDVLLAFEDLFRPPVSIEQVARMQFVHHTLVAEIVYHWTSRYIKKELSLEHIAKYPDFITELRGAFEFLLKFGDIASSLTTFENKEISELFLSRMSTVFKIIENNLTTHHKNNHRKSMIKTLYDFAKILSRAFPPDLSNTPTERPAALAMLVNQIVSGSFQDRQAWYYLSALLSGINLSKLSQPFFANLHGAAGVWFCLALAKQGKSEILSTLISSLQLASGHIANIVTGYLQYLEIEREGVYSDINPELEQVVSLHEYVLFFLAQLTCSIASTEETTRILMTNFQQFISPASLKCILFSSNLPMIKTVFTLAKRNPCRWPADVMKRHIKTYAAASAHLSSPITNAIYTTVSTIFSDNASRTPVSKAEKAKASHTLEKQCRATQKIKPNQRNHTPGQASSQPHTDNSVAQITGRIPRLQQTIANSSVEQKINDSINLFNGIEPPRENQRARIYQAFAKLQIQLNLIVENSKLLRQERDELLNQLESLGQSNSVAQDQLRLIDNLEHRCLMNQKELLDRIKIFETDIEEYKRKFTAPRLQHRPTPDDTDWRRSSVNRFRFLPPRAQNRGAQVEEITENQYQEQAPAINSNSSLTWQQLIEFDFDITPKW